MAILQYSEYLMINNDKLEEYRKTIQSIIDRILPKDERFSVKDFDEEGIYYLASLFLEKDAGKRKIIYENIEKRKKEAEKKLKNSEQKFLELNEEILRKKEQYDKMFNIIDELGSLSSDININQILNSNLDQL